MRHRVEAQLPEGEMDELLVGIAQIEQIMLRKLWESTSD